MSIFNCIFTRSLTTLALVISILADIVSSSSFLFLHVYYVSCARLFCIWLPSLQLLSSFIYSFSTASTLSSLLFLSYILCPSPFPPFLPFTHCTCMHILADPSALNHPVFLLHVRISLLFLTHSHLTLVCW